VTARLKRQSSSTADWQGAIEGAIDSIEQPGMGRHVGAEAESARGTGADVEGLAFEIDILLAVSPIEIGEARRAWT
jgi:hypothetical protein